MFLQTLTLTMTLALAAGGEAGAPPAVLALVTAPWATHSELVQLGEVSARGRFEHTAGAAVRGAVVPGGGVVAVADTSPRRDLSFAASLFVLADGHAARRLCDEVVHASRPFVSPEGRVFVVRGAAGQESDGSRLRDDFLRVDEIDLQTGVARTQHRFTGQLLHFAGWYDGALLVYRVDGDSVDIVAVDPRGGSVRTVLADLPPFARDFSVDATRGELVFLNRDEADPLRWHVLGLDLRGGSLRSLGETDSVRVGPFASGGAVHVAGPTGALARIGGRGPDPHSPCAELGSPDDPSGRSAASCGDVLRLASADGRWTAGLHHRPGALPRPFVLEAASGRATLLPAAGGWVELLGFAAEVTP